METLHLILYSKKSSAPPEVSQNNNNLTLTSVKLLLCLGSSPELYCSTWNLELKDGPGVKYALKAI